MNPSNIAAFFDLDGTIVPNDSFRMFLYYAYVCDYRRWRFLPSILSSILLRKARVISLRNAKERVLLGLRGMSKRDICELGRSFLEERLANDVRPRAYQRIQWHHSQEHTVFIVTGSPDIYVDHICRFLGAEGSLCTKLEFRGGIFTGKLAGEDLLGEEKVHHVKSIADDLKIDLDASYAYSDSVSDVPMLSIAGNPVVVNPGGDFGKIAHRRGWRQETW